MFDTSSFAQGLALGLGLFICPGPKDVLIARQALLRRPALELILIGVLSDACLIALGMVGASAALSQAPAWQDAALWLSVGLLVAHGASAARRAAMGSAELGALLSKGQAMPRRHGLRALLMVSFFNPLAWLDTVLVIGTVGAALPQSQQPAFAGGAVAASLAWFATLVLGAHRSARWMASPKAWRVLEGCVAVAMGGLAAHVLSGLL